MSIYEYDQARHIRQEREEAWEEGRQTGKQEGKQEEKRTIALNLVKMGMAAEQIAQAIGEETVLVEEWLTDTDK